jgi:hypothetical protein
MSKKSNTERKVKQHERKKATTMKQHKTKKKSPNGSKCVERVHKTAKTTSRKTNSETEKRKSKSKSAWKVRRKEELN